jgi:hypothetical protein
MKTICWWIFFPTLTPHPKKQHLYVPVVVTEVKKSKMLYF